jgi:hypothetical protein
VTLYRCRHILGPRTAPDLHLRWQLTAGPHLTDLNRGPLPITFQVNDESDKYGRCVSDCLREWTSRSASEKATAVAGTIAVIPIESTDDAMHPAEGTSE